MNPYRTLPEVAQATPVLVESDILPTSITLDVPEREASYVFTHCEKATDTEQLQTEEILTETSQTAEKMIKTVTGLGVFAVGASVEQAAESNLLVRSEEQKTKLSKKLSGVALSAAVLSAWGFEIGPWNETIRANVGFEVFENTYDAVKTGAAVFASTIPIEAIPAALVSIGMSREDFPGRKLMKWVHDKLGLAESGERERGKMDLMKDTSFALGVGVAALVAKRYFSEKTMTLKDGLIASAVLAPLTAVFAGGVGWATAYGILHAEGTKFESAADFLKENGTDPKFWLAVFGSLQAADIASKYIKKRRNATDASPIHS